MAKYHFTLDNAYRFGWRGLEGFAYSSKDDFPRASAALFIVTERHGRVRNLISDRIYLVLEGEGEFVIGDEVIPVKATDVVIVPRDTEYDYRGKLRLFLVHSPAYDASTDVDLENMQTQS